MVVACFLDITVIVGIGPWVIGIGVYEVVRHERHLVSLLGPVLLFTIPLALLLVLLLLFLFVLLVAPAHSRLLPLQVVLTYFGFCNAWYVAIGFNSCFCNFTLLAFVGLIHVTPLVADLVLEVVLTWDRLVEALARETWHETTIVRCMLHFAKWNAL